MGLHLCWERRWKWTWMIRLLPSIGFVPQRNLEKTPFTSCLKIEPRFFRSRFQKWSPFKFIRAFVVLITHTYKVHYQDRLFHYARTFLFLSTALRTQKWMCCKQFSYLQRLLCYTFSSLTWQKVLCAMLSYIFDFKTLYYSTLQHWIFCLTTRTEEIDTYDSLWKCACSFLTCVGVASVLFDIFRRESF